MFSRLADSSGRAGAPDAVSFLERIFSLLFSLLFLLRYLHFLVDYCACASSTHISQLLCVLLAPRYRHALCSRSLLVYLFTCSLVYLFTCLLQVKALFYDDEQTYDAEIVAETKLGFKVVFTEYGNDQVI